jgi:cobalt-zinc-cadmium efflux system membrane fusion protein
VTATTLRALAGLAAPSYRKLLPCCFALLALALAGCGGPPSETAAEGGSGDGDEAPLGPNGGHVLTQDDFALEVKIFEGDAPEFRLYPTFRGQPVPAADVQATIVAQRLTGIPGGLQERFSFAPRDGFLASTTPVGEPHSFTLQVSARHGGRDYAWTHESPEGLVTIEPDMAAAQGLTTASAGPGVIRETLPLYGSIEAEPKRVRSVRARFPGVVRSVAVQLGEVVRKGQTLATIESNETLQSYAVAAPIAGSITARFANPGEATDEQPLFVITDLSRVHVDLTIFPRDRARLQLGQRIEVRAAEGAAEGSGVLEYIVPMGGAGQSMLAHVELDNANGQWTPGQFVNAEAIVGEGQANLVVPLTALQTWRDMDVVFVAEGDRYQVIPVTLGRRDSRNAEVLAGLAPGARLVVGNSYLVKADIEKSGAAHDH